VFTHKPRFLFEELETIESDSKRLYKTPRGDLFPSVTTILSSMDKKGLMEWRARVGEEEATRISTQAATRGTAIHKMCEDFLNNEDPYKDQMPANVFTFNSIKPILEDHINNICCQEEPLYSYYLRAAGRVDCVAEYDGRLSIIDFKTSRKPKRREWIKGYFMQTSAYAVMFEELTETPISKLVIIIAVDDSEPQVFVEKRDDHIGRFIQQRQIYKEIHGV